ncbi:ERAD-associated E3 ubiquitin-protein ligase HRD1 [Elsinoe australis]|uniref:ERAD-associated E3 ubiquitin-protein ligase HRD1 n=1 Tax=Elsinoe australis TaxID=40998 RepID=A0A2P7YLA3_9PEZI|nr:ERAD-associated E3 ubiquitin-protein ligase HRD1 [Elsinoe australis]
MAKIKKSTSAHRQPPKSTYTISWSEEKRRTLAAAVITSQKPDTKWKTVARLWGSVHSDDASGIGNEKVLIARLRGQWGDKTHNSKRQWLSIPQTAEDLERQDPEPMRRFRTAVAGATLVDAAAILPETPRRPSRDVDDTPHTPPQSSDGRVTKQAPPATTTTTPLAVLADPFLTPIEDEIVVRSEHFSNQPLALSKTAQLQLQYAARLRESRSTDFGPYSIVPAEQAHPPTPSLFFRFYEPGATHVVNAPLENGFISGIFSGTNGGFTAPLTHDAEFLFTLIEHHVNRSAVLTPFVSVSNDFYWCMRNAVKKAAVGKEIRVSIIDGRAAAGDDGSKAYHLKAYSGQIRSRRAYKNGGWRPAGNSEFLIWGRIPKEAVVCDFAVGDFLGTCRSNKAFGDVFRAHYFESAGATNIIRRIMSQDHPELNLVTITTICDLFRCMYSSTTTQSFPKEEYITKLVSDIVQGWQIKPKRELSRPEWLALGQNFAETLCQKFDLPPMTTTHRNLARAFLFGMLSGFGDLNWQSDDSLKLKMIANAKAYGLEDPDIMYAAQDNPIIASIRSCMWENVSPSHARLIGPDAPTQVPIRSQGVVKRILSGAASSSGPATPVETRPSSRTPGTTAIKEVKHSRTVRIFDAVVIPRMLPTPAVSENGSPSRPGGVLDKAMVMIDKDEDGGYEMADYDEEE